MAVLQLLFRTKKEGFYMEETWILFSLNTWSKISINWDILKKENFYLLQLISLGFQDWAQP